MCEAMRRSKLLILGLTVSLAAGACPLFAEEAAQIKKNETGFYRDSFDQNVYYEATNFLHLERLGRAMTRRKVSSRNINIFDEVPDSALFENRHARSKMSAEALAKGYSENAGPDVSGTLSIVDGKVIDTLPMLIVKDASGNQYELVFDPSGFPEMASSASVIASRFFYAIGYNVPQITLVEFDPAKLEPAADGSIVDSSGFRKKITRDKLDEILLLIPQTAEGKLRAAAVKAIPGEDKGTFELDRDSREIRALRVFASWLNQYDVRQGITRAVVTNQDGKQAVKYYLAQFETALGSNGDTAKLPMAGHEYLVDYGETAKAFLSLGLWEKPWQKRWRAAGEELKQSPAIGYFDNQYFYPANFKPQLPYFAFKDLSRADAFWAAKIIMSFSNADIEAMVKAGGLSSAEDAAFISKTLAERRDMIGRYWFDQASALDDFSYNQNQLSFKDLAAEYGLQPKDGTVYKAEFYSVNGKKKHKTQSVESPSASITIPSGADEVLIRTVRPGSSKPAAAVVISLNGGAIAGIQHQD